MSWRTGKNIIHEQNAFLCYCPPCQIKYYGWKFRVEAHFGKKESNCPGSSLSSSKGFYAFGGIISSWFGSREYSYFATLPQNSTRFGYNSCFWPEASFPFFFFNIQFWDHQNRMEKYIIYIRSKTFLNLPRWRCPDRLFLSKSIYERFINLQILKLRGKLQ